MTAHPYGTEQLCRGLSNEQLDATFFYPGPPNAGRSPSHIAWKAWEQAKEICIECPVFVTCRENSWGQQTGVVGGTDQYERYLYRRRLANELRVMPAEERAALAAKLSRRYGHGLRETMMQITISTGYSPLAVRTLLEEHDRATNARKPAEPVKRRMGPLDADELERIRSMASKDEAPRMMATTLGRSLATVVAALAELDVVSPERVWPKGPPPKSDAWVWHHGLARTAHYLGQTDDGMWMYMSLRGLNKSPTRKWFPKDSVDLRSQVPVRILEKRGVNAA